MVLATSFTVVLSLMCGDVAVSQSEQECLARRRAIKQAFVRLECRTLRGNDAGQMKLRRHFEMRCWLEDAKMRTETRELSESESAPYFTDQLRRVAAAANGDVIEFTSQVLDDGQTVGGSLWPADIDPNHIARELIDPRKIGVASGVTESLNQAVFDKLVGRVGRVTSEESDEVLGERKCRRVTYQLANGLRRQIWLLPACDFSVVQMETNEEHHAHAYHETWEIELQQAPPHQIWFPKTLRFRQERDGQVTMDEVTTIHEVRLNEDIDDEVFTLAGMEVPEGQPFFDHRRGDGELARWDGSRLVSVDHPEEALAERRSPLLLWGASLGLAALAGLLLWRFWTNLRQPA